MKLKVKSLIAATVLACSATSCLGADLQKIESVLVEGAHYSLTTDVSDQTITVQLVSLVNRKMCYASDQWPTPGGWLASPNEAFLRIEARGKDYFMSETRTGRPDPLFRTLHPKEKVNSHIGLDWFSLPEDVAPAEITVHYNLAVFECPR